VHAGNRTCGDASWNGQRQRGKYWGSSMSGGTLTFEEYWVAFVRAHASPSLRRLSFASMSAGIGTATAFLLTRRSVFLVLSPLVAFVPPWLARKLAGEPEVLHRGYPLFYAAANLKLWHLTLTGAMEEEVDRIMASVPFEPPFDDEEQLPRPNMVTDHTLH
jgi:hypothetical protein